MSYALDYIAKYIEAELVSASSVIDAAEIEVVGFSNPKKASSNQLTFIASKNYVSELENTAAAAVILTRDLVDQCPNNSLVVDNPYLAYARLTELFSEPLPDVGIDSSAVIADSAIIGEGCSVGPNAVIGDQVIIGNAAVVGPGVSLGNRAKVGDRSQIKANVSIYHDVIIGSDCIIHSGTVIGSDGFGFAPSPEGYIKIHQLGSVVVGDGVEIGANTSIDRGALGDTEIHDGVKIDNMVHIAHNCIIGANTAVAGQVGMAGTTVIGKGCTFGGQVGIAGHLSIADNVHVTGKSMVTKSIVQAGLYSSGTGFSDNRSWRKNAVRFNQLDDIYKRLVRVEKNTKNDNIDNND